MTTYYARKEYVYDSGDTIFSIPFSYIKKEHIVVLINGENTNNYTYINTTQIRVTDTLQKGDKVTVARTTPINERMVIFSDTAILNKDVQNLAQIQTFNAVQEIYDNNEVFKIETNDTLASDKAEIEGIVETNKQELLAQVASDKADTDKQIADYKKDTDTQIKNFETTINSSVTDIDTRVDKANTTAANAVKTAENANTKADSAVTKATTAETVSNNANNTSNNALEIVKDALSKAETAVDTADTAKTTSEEAVVTANVATATATAASNKVNEFEKDIDTVLEAAEKINELETAVGEAKTAATDATEAASTANTAAEQATEAANNAIAALDNKQDKITDLATIRTGASRGATAVQPSQLHDGKLTLKANGTEVVAFTANQSSNVEADITSTWGSIAGQIENQTDLKTTLDTKASTSLDNLTDEGIKFIKNNSSGLEVCDIGVSLYVDESKGLRRYLNGSIFYMNANTQVFLSKLKKIVALYPSLLDTEENWQAAKTLSPYGQVGKFVFNYDTDGTTIVSVRLPRVVNIQGLTDLSNLGLTVPAGLPTLTTNSTGAHTHSRGSMEITGGINNLDSGGSVGEAYGAFSKTGAWEIHGRGTNNSPHGSYDFVASRTWSGVTSSEGTHAHTITGSSTTVQQEAVQFPYFIQVATGAEESDKPINNYQVNNVYSLFDCKFADHKLNNSSWLRSEGQYNSGTVYTSPYQELLAEYNNTESTEETENGVTFKRTPKGYKIALASQKTTIDSLYSSTGVAWYYVLDTANEQFMLPRTKYGFSGVRSKAGNYISESLPNITGNFGAGMTQGTFINFGEGAFTAYRDADNSTHVPTDGGAYEANNRWNFDASRSSSAYKDGAPVQERSTEMYLYFYIGDTLQNTDLINIARLQEELVDKITMVQASKAGMPSNRYVNLTLGASGNSYTAPANGYFYVQKTATSDDSLNFKYLGAYNETTGYYDERNGAYQFKLCCLISALAGEKVFVNYNATGDTRVFRFIYAEGAK